MKVNYFKGKDGLWYWRAVAGNGRIIADGGEGYSRKYNAQRAYDRFTDLVLDYDTLGHLSMYRKKLKET